MLVSFNVDIPQQLSHCYFRTYELKSLEYVQYLFHLLSTHYLTKHPYCYSWHCKATGYTWLEAWPPLPQYNHCISDYKNYSATWIVYETLVRTRDVDSGVVEVWSSKGSCDSQAVRGIWGCPLGGCCFVKSWGSEVEKVKGESVSGVEIRVQCVLIILCNLISCSSDGL